MSLWFLCPARCSEKETNPTTTSPSRLIIAVHFSPAIYPSEIFYSSVLDAVGGILKDPFLFEVLQHLETAYFLGVAKDLKMNLRQFRLLYSWEDFWCITERVPLFLTARFKLNLLFLPTADCFNKRCLLNKIYFLSHKTFGHIWVNKSSKEAKYPSFVNWGRF